MALARSPSVLELQRIGVTKNQGRSDAARTCSTSRKSTFRQRDDEREPGTSAANSTASGIASSTSAARRGRR